MIKCEHCGRSIRDDLAMISPEDEKLCGDCFSEDWDYCSNCGYVFPVEAVESVYVRIPFTQPSRFSSEVVCEKCRSDMFSECRDCGEWYEREYMEVYRQEYPQVYYLCPSCYSENYFRCVDCEEIYHNDQYSSDDRCHDCYHSSDEDQVHETSRPVVTVRFKHSPDLDRIIADPRSEM